MDRAAAEAVGGAPGRQVISGPYLDAVRRLMVVDELPAWQLSVRSSIRHIGTPKRHLVDPSLAAALLNVGPDRLVADLETLGFLFESLATRDLRVYAQAADASCSHYRQRDGRGEIDVVVEDYGSGRWVGFEVKLGSNPELTWVVCCGAPCSTWRKLQPRYSNGSVRPSTAKGRSSPGNRRSRTTSTKPCRR